MSDGNEFLMSGGVPSVPFEHVGTTVTMRITSPPQKRAVTDPATGEVKTFANGDPIHQVTVGVATGLRDPSNPDDNGDRTLFIKNKMLGAIREAVKRTGATGLEVGGILTVSFVGEEPPKTRGLNPTKLYQATYQPPPPGAAGNDALMGGATTAAQGQAPMTPPGYQAPAPVTTPGPQEHWNQQPAYAQPAAAGAVGYAPGWNAGQPVQGGAVGYAPAGPTSSAATGAQWAQGGAAPWLQNGQPVAAQSFAPAVPPPPPPPPGIDPNQWPHMWANMSDAQRAQVTAALAGVAAQTPPF